MHLSRSKNLLIIVLLDSILVLSSLYLAHLIRFEFNMGKDVHNTLLQILPLAIGVKLVCFWIMGLYKGMWRYTSLNSLANVLKATIFSSVIIVIYILWRYRFVGISRAVFLTDLFLTFIFVSGIRVFIRLCYEKVTQKLNFREIYEYLLKIFKRTSNSVVRTVIIGAGDCGEKIYREIKDNSTISSKVLGFLDDDCDKIGRTIHGVPVIDQIEQLALVVKNLDIEQVIIALPSVKATRMRQIVELCKGCDINFKIVPKMGELINGKVTVNAIRDVEYRDLLGREQVDLDTEQIGGYLRDKTILVTGAGGSIGAGLCNQICNFSPQKIILFERAESPLYEIDLELKKNFPKIKVTPILGDIQNAQELRSVFREFSPQIVFHAAAYKHVPMLEYHPWKAVANNIVGTENLVEEADRNRCEKFVFISTDKAVNPANIMGASKRISEIIVQNRNLFSHSKTHFVTVRFGNVIGSVGSVIPLFKKQIKQGGPVTVTHPDIMRYFMLIPEACQLILQAGAMGKGGEIFVLEMGEPINIASMARDLIRFSGFEPDVDIKVEFTGLRPGEKLFEELMTDDEDVVTTDHRKIHVFGCCKINMNQLNGKLDQLKKISESRNSEKIRSLMMDIVPEFKPRRIMN